MQNSIIFVQRNDIELSEYLGLTTVHQPMFEMGKLAVDRLMERIDRTDLQHFSKSFPTQLIIRETCGASKVVAA